MTTLHPEFICTYCNGKVRYSELEHDKVICKSCNSVMLISELRARKK